MRNLISSWFAFIALLTFSCSDERNARVEVWLTDGPGDFQKVNIDLQAVEIHSSETEDENGWASLDVTPRTYDLLTLTNGEETLLGDIDMPGGKISQVRLKLGENNTVMVDDQVHPLQTPSAQQSGLKVKINKVLAEGVTYKILLDFDAAKSVVRTGDGAYILKPVIRAITEPVGGSITGKVDPAGITTVAVISDEETVTTTQTNEAGEFLIRGLQAGTYLLTFDGPGDAPVVEKSDVMVTIGEITDIGVVSIEE